MRAIKRRILRLEGELAHRCPREICLPPELRERAEGIMRRILANPDQWPAEIAIIEASNNGETSAG